jgi:hypothetical protein
MDITVTSSASSLVAHYGLKNAKTIIIFFEINNAARDISVSGVANIYDVTSERLP